MIFFKLFLFGVLYFESTAEVIFPCSFAYNEHKRYLCINYYSDINDDAPVDSITGNHSKLLDNSHVEGLMILSRKVRKIPGRLFSSFSNLKEFDFSCLSTKNSCLVAIGLYKGVFHGAGKLNTINLRGHKLELKADLFQGLEQLQFLILPSNSISEVVKDSFKGISELKILALNNNQIRSLSPGIFDGLIRLESLQLEGNDLTTLPKSLFANLKKLRQINLQQNKLKKIDFTFEAKLPQLEIVNLIDNLCIDGYFSNTTGIYDLQVLDQSLAACSAQSDIYQPKTNSSLQNQNKKLQMVFEQDRKACTLTFLKMRRQEMQREFNELLPFKMKLMKINQGEKTFGNDRLRRYGPQNAIDQQLIKLMQQNRNLMNFNDKLNGVADEIIEFMVHSVKKQ